MTGIKKELADKQLRVIIILVIYTTKKLKNKESHFEFKTILCACIAMWSYVFLSHSLLAKQGLAEKARHVKTVKMCLYLMLFNT